MAMATRTCVMAIGVWFVASIGHAAIFGTVEGIVDDPQHHPVPQANITVRSPVSGWQQQTESDADGRFALTMVPAGQYVVSVVKPGFQTLDRQVVVRSGTVTSLAFTLTVGAIAEKVDVVAEVINAKSATTESLVTRDQIERTPGALRTNSLDMVTQFVPGAYMVHDQLHIRGGHQISWLVDGLPVPNTNIATTVGPQFDPKDIETMEVQRGGYSADYGDRTYGVFNIVTRSGFERSREAEALFSYGNPNETNAQFNIGDHNDRTGYYASVNANRTDLGLETPVADTIHDQGQGIGAFLSLIHKATTTDQLRLVASVRGDRFQIPNTPDDQAAGIDDVQRERDVFINTSWLHTIGSGAFLTVSPFYHFNRAALDGGPNDPVITTDHRTSQYVGGQAVLALSQGRHNARVGVYGFYQHDDALFGLASNDTGESLSQAQSVNGNLEVLFAQDQYAATDWLTVNGGLRFTRFSGPLTEYAVNPRVGVAVRAPWGWAVRAFYGQYYQEPPLTTITGPLLDLAVEQGFGFLPLKGERDTQYEIGVGIPVREAAIDLALFRTNATNFFDHDVIGNSNIFIPVTIDQARVRGFEATVRTPVRQRARARLAYSHQFVEGRGAVSGGLTAFEPPSDDYFFLDHDQRDTLTGGVDIDLPAATWAAVSVAFGSGFLEGDGPDHLPAHTIVNLQGGKTIGKNWTLVVTALNIADTRFLLDESNTFGGTHYNSPRQIAAGVRYRFRY
jgi:outer membrane receptor for ferrienterochelin and colicin